MTSRHKLIETCHDYVTITCTIYTHRQCTPTQLAMPLFGALLSNISLSVYFSFASFGLLVNIHKQSAFQIAPNWDRILWTIMLDRNVSAYPLSFSSLLPHSVMTSVVRGTKMKMNIRVSSRRWLSPHIPTMAAEKFRRKNERKEKRSEWEIFLMNKIDAVGFVLSVSSHS